LLLKWGPNDLPLYRRDDRFLWLRQLARVVEAIQSRRGLHHKAHIVGYDLAVTLGLPFIGGCGFSLDIPNGFLQRRSLTPKLGFGNLRVETAALRSARLLVEHQSGVAHVDVEGVNGSGNQ
jgi:hypothetical protein